ncbi:MAG: ester cyclase [Anaerolineae bacterium]
MSLEENKTVIRRWFEEMNKGNMAAVDEFYGADYVLHDPNVPPDLPRGPASVRRYLAPIMAGFPDSSVTVDDVIAEGDKIAVRFTARGNHTGDFMGIPPSGKPIEARGISIIRIADGQMVEEWQNFDILTLLQQIGAIPTMAE